ncbi:RNA 2',3'-cyclic phosphodiesterase [Natranaerobius thermophilus]|uniref:RNA 2',3'-cyclic phosphodiesterase n=1 Tax=Natranaerobius thermophilus (strain ATCC BAA-1301 / DSM 18059 / JW/NM-WN-LF) TaxID=457570 RepID=B2A6J9_NATTJ|nr:RNA 2',3'-cyclic phosphodiesterase [Natranaerobius thermophilus]ACB85532.1 2'-5' RNA ligase [Natranaerobius thermophilus JW/NM-WN-LF]
MRSFIAIFFNSKVVESLARNQNLCREKGIKGKYVKPDNIHLTVKFLGDVEQNALDKLQLLDQELEQIEPLKLRLSHLGVFPGKGRPRVLWQGLSGDDIKDLQQIHQEVEQFTERELKIAQEKKKFRPHVTLLRNPDIPKGVSIDQISKEELERPEILVDSISLIKSELTPKGPIYTELKRFVFNNS